MRVYIGKKSAAGVFVAPPSKSFCHRALICAALGQGESLLHGVYRSNDIDATMACLAAMGADIDSVGDAARVRGFDPLTACPTSPLPCGESGSTLRFLTAIALLSEQEVTLTGTGRLLQRPLDAYEKLCAAQGLLFQRQDGSLSVRGRLSPGSYPVDASVSSQFATGLMLALPLLPTDSEIILTGQVTSRPYLQITAEVMRQFGVTAEVGEQSIRIPGGQRYLPTEYTVEGDHSGAAFFEAMNRLGSRITLTGLRRDSVQGDRVFGRYFDQICAGMPTLDIRDCPDLAPVLMALGAARNGVTLTGTARLRVKESDRGAAMAQELEKFGIRTEIGEDTLTVYGGRLLPPRAPICSHGDHRIVMACAVLLMTVGGEIQHAEDVRKSFPDFFEKLRALGAEVNTIEA